MEDIQLGGNLMLGTVPADYSDYISSMVITTSREAITRPPTLGKPVRSNAAGAPEYQLKLTFHSSLAAASLWAELWDTVESANGEIAFSGNLEEGVTGPDNPEFSGTITVMSLDTGADVGKLRQQSQTYSVTADGVTKAVI